MGRIWMNEEIGIRYTFKYKYEYGTCYEVSLVLGDDEEAEIIVDYSQVVQACARSGVSFDYAFAQMVSHEILHHILLTQISKEACDKLDNITCDRFDDDDAILGMLKYMCGGILCKQDIPKECEG